MAVKPLDYLWTHVDYGKSQGRASGDWIYKYDHGDLLPDGEMFRIVDKEYDKEWLRENLPALKQEWKRRRMNKYDELLAIRDNYEILKRGIYKWYDSTK